MLIRLALFTVLLATLSACQPRDAAMSDAELAAQQDSLFRRDAPQVLAEVKAMVDADQAVRNLYEYGTADSALVDSLSEQQWDAMFESGTAPKSMSPDDPWYRIRFSPRHRRTKDSLDKAMAAQDKKHTARMVELIRKYGYPSSHRLDSTTNVDPFILLHHPDATMKNVVMPLLTRELALGRMDSNGYEMVRWSHNGRQGLPALPNNMKVDTSSVKGAAVITFE